MRQLRKIIVICEKQAIRSECWILVRRRQSAGKRERLGKKHQTRYRFDAATGFNSRTNANPDETAQFCHA